MSLSIRSRLFIAHALIVVTTLVILTLLASTEQRRWLIQHNVSTLERAARLVAREVASKPPLEDLAWSRLADAMGRAFDARVTLVDSAGRVLGDSEVPEARLKTLDNHAGRPEIRAALSGRTGQAVRYSRTLDLDHLYVAVPVRARGIAVVRVSEPLTVIARLNASLLRLLVVAGALTLLVILAVTYWLTGRLSARVLELETVAARLGAGEPARAREQPADEIGRLGRAMNRMSAESRARLDALESERDERESILAHMSDGVALIDASGNVVHMNRSLSEMLGVPLPAESGTPFRAFVRAPEIEELIASARSRGDTVESDLRLWVPRQRRLQATATPVRRPGGEAVLLVLRDLTEAERLDRVRQDFVANVSHELRTPLTSLRGYAETLLEGGLDDLEHRERFVRVIRDQAVRLEALAEDLLSLAQLERPGARPRGDFFDLRELVERLAAVVGPRASAAKQRIELAPGPEAPVVADRLQIEQAVANLLENAVRHADPGRIGVRVGATETGAWVEVEDEGPGIDEEEQARIFERFYRVDKARSRERGGTGLGLSIVKHVAALHGGEVRVRSRPGEGSLFRLEIPRTQGPAAAAG